MKKFFKYIFFSIILFGLSFTSIAQELPGTKVVKTHYPNGVLKTEGQYWYDKLDGFYKEYYPNGKIWKDWKFSFVR